MYTTKCDFSYIGVRLNVMATYACLKVCVYNICIRVIYKI